MKRWSVMALAGCLTATLAISTGATEVTASQIRTADALYALGLFRGTGSDAEGQPIYSLEKTLTRYEGYTLLVRMLGAEETAQQGYADGRYEYDFTDVTEDWAKPYVAYAAEQGLTNGVGNGRFAGQEVMTEQMFLTMLLRALGYSSDEDGDFTWNTVYSFANSRGLSAQSVPDPDWNRGDTVELFWRALQMPMVDGKQTLAQELCKAGVFTTNALRQATSIYSGESQPIPARESGGGAGGGGGGASTGGNTEPTVCGHETTHTEVTQTASCTRVGSQTTVCTACGETVATKELSMLAHDYRYHSDAQSHWQLCEVCHHATAVQEHCADAENLCTVCGAEVARVYELPKIKL